MNVLIFIDVFNAMIKQEFGDLAHKKIIEAIIRNESLEILYSKRMLEILKENLSEDDVPNFQSIATMLADRSESLPSSTFSKTMEEEAIYLNSTSVNDIILNIAYSSPNIKDNPSLPKTAVISSSVKPNYDWLVCNMAILYPNKVTVESWDFARDSQIKTFFDDAFSLPKKLEFVNIFDTQCNTGHIYFDGIVRRAKVGYFTKKASGGTVGDEDNYEKLHLKFLSNFKMFTVSASKAHGRRILFNNVVLSIDNDYWNLKTNAQDWFIDIQINSDVAAKLHQRRALYTQFIPKRRR